MAISAEPAHLRGVTFFEKPSMRILVLSSDLPSRSDWWPPLPPGFIDFRAELVQQLGCELDVHTRLPIDQIWPLIAERRPDVVFLLVSWGYSAREILSGLATCTSSPSRPSIVFLDQVDQSSSPFLELLPHVDLFLKAQVLRDRGAYTVPTESGYVFTDFLSKKLGYDLQGWAADPCVADPQHVAKLQPGWNLGVASYVRSLSRLGRIAAIPWRLRPFDFNCRLGFGKDNDVGWYATYRRFARQVLSEASGGYRCTGVSRVGRNRYLLEVACSRIVFSPFGWGEVCSRDFDAVALGALLVKPTMDHIETNINIYIPYETYIPLKWDLSDMDEKCRWALAHPEESSRIAFNASRALRDYFSRHGFIEDFCRILKQLERD
jgi:hypothetical protein